jgi:hypothetical protein
LKKRRTLNHRQYGLQLTQEQEAAAKNYEREREANARGRCNWQKFWRGCSEKTCRRRKSCSGDAVASWEEKWAAMPQILKEQLKRAIWFMKDGMRPDLAFRAAKDQLMRELEEEIARRERNDAGAAASTVDAPASVDAPPLPATIEPPMPRIRQL